MVSHTTTQDLRYTRQKTVIISCFDSLSTMDKPSQDCKLVLFRVRANAGYRSVVHQVIGGLAISLDYLHVGGGIHTLLPLELAASRIKDSPYTAALFQVAGNVHPNLSPASPLRTHGSGEGTRSPF